MREKETPLSCCLRNGLMAGLCAFRRLKGGIRQECWAQELRPGCKCHACKFLFKNPNTKTVLNKQLNQNGWDSASSWQVVEALESRGNGKESWGDQHEYTPSPSALDSHQRDWCIGILPWKETNWHFSKEMATVLLDVKVDSQTLPDRQAVIILLGFLSFAFTNLGEENKQNRHNLIGAYVGLNNPNSLSLSSLAEVFHPSDHFCGPPLDPLQQVHVFPVLRAPELDAVLQYSQVLVCRAALNSFIPQPVSIPGVAPTHVQTQEPHEVHTGPLLELVQVPVDGIPSFSLHSNFAILLFQSKCKDSLAKQPQFPQPLLIRLLLQTLHQLRCPSLHTLQYLNVSLVVRGPKLNTVFEVRPHQCRVEGHDHFPTPAGHTIFDTSQDAIGFLGHLGTLLAHILLAVNQHTQVLLCWAAFQPLFPKPVALHGVAVAQGQDLALRLVEPHTIDLSPSIQPVQSLPTLKQINTATQLGVICKLTEGALDPFVQIIDKDIKQNWPQHRALGNTACDRPPTGVNSIHHHSLGPAIQPVLYPAKSTPVQAMSSQFLQKNAVGNRVKGFTEV
ncbi:hypothetical protein QYF61_002865 [Mycteria americana]|uniref:Uncharacterized protein n=1 Tax=Mycteria americana TaxID=33587 RepID=A0AAN7N9L7_MYCAM|nr:hypothetical protein QYF61_002865 [Mycteria americana]